MFCYWGQESIPLIDGYWELDEIDNFLKPKDRPDMAEIDYISEKIELEQGYETELDLKSLESSAIKAISSLFYVY